LLLPQRSELLAGLGLRQYDFTSHPCVIGSLGRYPQCRIEIGHGVFAIMLCLIDQAPHNHTRQLVGAWVADYNTARPRSLLGYRTLRRMPTISPQPTITLRYLQAPRSGRLLTPRRKAYQSPRL